MNFTYRAFHHGQIIDGPTRMFGIFSISSARVARSGNELERVCGTELSGAVNPSAHAGRQFAAERPTRTARTHTAPAPARPPACHLSTLATLDRSVHRPGRRTITVRLRHQINCLCFQSSSYRSVATANKSRCINRGDNLLSCACKFPILHSVPGPSSARLIPNSIMSILFNPAPACVCSCASRLCLFPLLAVSLCP